jgi:hypothetical protein
MKAHPSSSFGSVGSLRSVSLVRIALSMCGLITLSSQANAEVRPDRVHVADAKKSLSYVHDGLFVGGDRAIESVMVKDIRRAPNAGYERIVIDLDLNQQGEAARLSRPPFYQLAVNGDEKRLVFTLWGNPSLSFDAKKLVQAFRKSQIVKNLVLYPKVEDQTWTFVMELQKSAPVEVFELSEPARIIFDIKHASTAKAQVIQKPKLPKSVPAIPTETAVDPELELQEGNNG